MILYQKLKNVKKSLNYSINANSKVLHKLENMKDKSTDKICHTIMYEHYNKLTKNNDQLSIYLIMTKAMSEEIRNNKIYQYFGDET